MFAGHHAWPTDPEARMDDDKRTLDELIAELNQMRGRIDILRQLANALIFSHDARMRAKDDGEPPSGGT